ncbi:MAG: rhodanese-like domain-containing protein [Candidatus Zixiibacteriota bacterium]
MTFRQFFVLLLLAAVLGLLLNTVSPNRIPWIGNYRNLSSGEGPIVPPDAQEGDPPFVDINQAQMEFELGLATFVDARDREEFVCGTIPGSVNVPFEYLPEGDLVPYFDSAFGGISRDKALVVFCSGEECDLSLHLARNLRQYGYTNVLIFFGGAREWEKFGLEVERRAECAD